MILRIMEEKGKRVVMPSATVRWRLAPRTMTRGLTEGWLSVGPTEVTLHTPEVAPDVRYRILSRFGWAENGKPDATRRFFDLERLEG